MESMVLLSYDKAMKHFALLILIIAAMLSFSTQNSEAACSISPVSLNFGSYNYLTPTALDATATVVITCTPKTKATITIGPSTNSGNTGGRYMLKAGDNIPFYYNIYSDKRRSTVWDQTGILVNSNRPVTIYGRIPNGQNVPVGLYTDSMIMTISP